MSGVVARLGYVLGWIGNGLAAPFAIGAVFALGQDVQHRLNGQANQLSPFWLLLAGCALVIFLAGRALRYIFAGPSEPLTEKQRAFYKSIVSFLCIVCLIPTGLVAIALWLLMYNHWVGASVAPDYTIAYAIGFSIAAVLFYFVRDEIEFFKQFDRSK